MNSFNRKPVMGKLRKLIEKNRGIQKSLSFSSIYEYILDGILS